MVLPYCKRLKCLLWPLKLARWKSIIDDALQQILKITFIYWSPSGCHALSQRVPKLLLFIGQISQPPATPTPVCPPFQSICISLKYSVLFHLQVLMQVFKAILVLPVLFCCLLFKWTSKAASSLEVRAGTVRLFESQCKSVIRARRFQP